MLGWSNLLIHSALLDLRLTVQLLPIKVETQKKRGNTERRKPLSQEEPALHIEVGNEKLFIKLHLLFQQDLSVSV